MKVMPLRFNSASTRRRGEDGRPLAAAVHLLPLCCCLMLVTLPLNAQRRADVLRVLSPCEPIETATVDGWGQNRVGQYAIRLPSGFELVPAPDGERNRTSTWRRDAIRVSVRVGSYALKSFEAGLFTEQADRQVRCRLVSGPRSVLYVEEYVRSSVAILVWDPELRDRDDLMAVTTAISTNRDDVPLLRAIALSLRER